MAKLSSALRLIAVAATCIAIQATPSAAQPAEQQKPNIVFLISDDHRWDGLSLINPKVKTPNLDQMAREGQWYRQATIQTPLCATSRAAILTGLPPYRNGWYSNKTQRADVVNPHGFDQYKTLPKQMIKAGYHTAFAGKWHLVPDPWLVGFETVKHWMLGGMGPYKNPKLAEGRSREKNTVKGFTQKIFTDDALEIMQKKIDGETTKPLFLWVAYTAPHMHFHPNPEPYESMYKGKTPGQLAPDATYTGDPTAVWKPETTWNRYYSAISALDAQVGRIMDTIRESSLADNTLVVFLGDNGFMMGSHGVWGKLVPYEGSVRVPLIVWGPNEIVGATGTTVTASVNSLDLPPTFVRLAGGMPPAEWTGRDVTAVLKDGKPHDITWAVSVFSDSGDPERAYRMMRTPEYKLIKWHPDSGQKPALYDLKADPAEENNLYGLPQAAQMQKKLETHLAQYRQKTGDESWDMQGPVNSLKKENKTAKKKNKGGRKKESRAARREKRRDAGAGQQ